MREWFRFLSRQDRGTTAVDVQELHVDSLTREQMLNRVAAFWHRSRKYVDRLDALKTEFDRGFHQIPTALVLWFAGLYYDGWLMTVLMCMGIFVWAFCLTWMMRAHIAANRAIKKWERDLEIHTVLMRRLEGGTLH